MTRFAVIGLDHRHVYEMTEELIAAGMDCAGYWPETSDTRVLAGFRKRFPDLREVAEEGGRICTPETEFGLDEFEVVCAPVNDAADIVDDPHFRERTLSAPGER